MSDEIRVHTRSAGRVQFACALTINILGDRNSSTRLTFLEINHCTDHRQHLNKLISTTTTKLHPHLLVESKSRIFASRTTMTGIWPTTQMGCFYDLNSLQNQPHILDMRQVVPNLAQQLGISRLKKPLHNNNNNKCGAIRLTNRQKQMCERLNLHCVQSLVDVFYIREGLEEPFTAKVFYNPRSSM